ncbi:hypothetical protein GQ53DRAFT_708827 [Thozetella sp. PMI_491]|nr:hypothetical protein GQ53DRAFT_708827 [Thozetella sp. PMI_491]
MYEDIKRIAALYGLTAEELDYHCTVASPKRGEPPVFYPYHILSRPQAQQFGWDWPALVELAGFMLQTMRRECNKHAERAGLGENDMDARRVVYWMAHHFCKKIRSLKAEMGEDLPLVPWRRSCFRASLCKNQDHGVALLFGLVCPEGEAFDPVYHFDLGRCTVTLDSVSMNMAMRNYCNNTWTSIRDALRSIPLHSVFWRVDPRLGREIWNGGASDTSVVPEPPAPEFDVPMVSLDAWFVDGGMYPHFPYACPSCPEELLVSPGELIRHCREYHSTAGHAVDHTRPEQDDVDR